MRDKDEGQGKNALEGTRRSMRREGFTMERERMREATTEGNPHFLFAITGRKRIHATGPDQATPLNPPRHAHPR